jgi:hypothetical protein
MTTATRAAMALDLVLVKRVADRVIEGFALPILGLDPLQRAMVDDASRAREMASRELLRLAADAGGALSVGSVEVHVTRDGDGTAIFDAAGELGLKPDEPWYARHIYRVRRDAAAGAEKYRRRVAEGRGTKGGAA